MLVCASYLLRFGRHQIGNNPLVDGVCPATIHAGGDRKPGGTLWADSLRMESVKRLRALWALPKASEWRRGLATGTSKSHVTWQLCQSRQRPRLLQSLPAVHQDEHRKNAEPERVYPHGEGDQPNHSRKADKSGNHQAAGPSQYKPPQRAKNLATIKWIDGQHVENQQTQVDEPHSPQQGVSIGHGRRPAHIPTQEAEPGQEGNERDIHQRPGRDPPPTGAPPPSRLQKPI